MTPKTQSAEVIIIGGGLAGLSGAIYLGRAKRHTLLIDDGKSMARWEPDVQNYLGFPQGIAGTQLLARAREQAHRYHIRFRRDRIIGARARGRKFSLRGERSFYTCQRLLLATGIFHIPPEIPGVTPCLGHSLFFCKDCDGYRVQGKPIAVYGWNNQAVDYALGMLLYSPRVSVVTNGRDPRWDRRHARWVKEFHLPILCSPITRVLRQGHQIQALEFSEGDCIQVSALFTTRGDIYHNDLAKELGAKLNPDGEIIVDLDLRTNVRGLYAAGCVSPANCQMIIAAGQGAAAAQTINRDLLEEDLANHSLRRFRSRQVRRGVARIARQPTRRPRALVPATLSLAVRRKFRARNSGRQGSSSSRPFGAH